MQMAFELSTRQAGRVLEHAVRSRAAIEIEPRNREDGLVFRGVLDGRERNLLCVKAEATTDPLGPLGLVGVFADVRLFVGGQLYLFNSCVLDVSDSPDPTYVMMAMPESVLVANRRRSERLTIPAAAQTRILHESGKVLAHALLADVSVDGLSCAMPPPAEDGLFVGDGVRVVFELPGTDQDFELPATVANKSVTSDRQLLTLGVEFSTRANPNDVATLERLRGELLELIMNSNHMDG